VIRNLRRDEYFIESGYPFVISISISGCSSFQYHYGSSRLIGLLRYEHEVSKEFWLCVYATISSPYSRAHALVYENNMKAQKWEAWERRGDTILRIGKKHNGKKYNEIQQEDPGYCQWVKDQKNPGGPLKDFQRFLTSDEAAPEHAVRMPEADHALSREPDCLEAGGGGARVCQAHQWWAGMSYIRWSVFPLLQALPPEKTPVALTYPEAVSKSEAESDGSEKKMVVTDDITIAAD
jgi:hypothetical protein